MHAPGLPGGTALLVVGVATLRSLPGSHTPCPDWLQLLLLLLLLLLANA